MLKLNCCLDAFGCFREVITVNFKPCSFVATNIGASSIVLNESNLADITVVVMHFKSMFELVVFFLKWIVLVYLEDHIGVRCSVNIGLIHIVTFMLNMRSFQYSIGILVLFEKVIK